MASAKDAREAAGHLRGRSQRLRCLVAGVRGLPRGRRGHRRCRGLNAGAERRRCQRQGQVPE
eukprot:306707-Alexandrium_andersonii.AAC.1